MIKINNLIIGAGLTGLTTAYNLSMAGKKVMILEKSNKPGGVIQTMRKDSFVYESGPNSGVIAHPEVFKLFDELNHNCTLETANTNSKKRLIWKNNNWHALPSGLISAVGTPLFSLKDKFRILGEPFRNKGNDPDENVADLVKRRLGRSFLDYAVDPFISGIYAGDPEKIITRYALPKLYNLEQDYGSFIKGAIRKKKQIMPPGEKMPTREVFSAAGGLGKLIEALMKSIGPDSVKFGCEKILIERKGKSYVTTFIKDNSKIKIESDNIITTVGSYALPEILKFITKEELKPVTDLEYAKVIQVAVGFKKWKGIRLDAFGGLVPSIENRKILGVLFTSSIFKTRAPSEGALLSVFMGGIKNKNVIKLSDDKITEIVIDEISRMLNVENFSPELLKIFRYENAIPQYGIDSGLRLNRISLLEKKFPGLYLAGNIRDGIGMADRIRQSANISKIIISKN